MIRNDLPGWYGSQRPDGTAVRLRRDSHLDTSWGRVELPSGPGWKSNVLYLDAVLFSGRMVIAGQSDAGPAGCWLWQSGMPWKIVGPAHGMEMVRFSDDGRYLFCVDSNETGWWYDLAVDQRVSFSTYFGVNGIRSVHGPNRTMQTGISTMSDPSRLISKYTTLSDGLVIAQANGSGTGPSILAIRGNDRRILEAGTADFYKANQSGSRLAVAITKQTEGRCVTLELDVAELDSLPLEPSGADVTVPPVNKPLWLGWIQHDAGGPVPPGNCLMKVFEAGHITRYDGTQFAQWVQALHTQPHGVDEIERQCAASPWPCVAYWDQRGWPRLPQLKPNDWLGLQMYALKSEEANNFAAFEANMRWVLDGVPQLYQNVAIIAQAYEQPEPTKQTTNLVPLVPVFARLARDYPRVTMVLCFSDYNRWGGMNTNPEIRPYWQSMANTITIPANGGGGGTLPPVDFNKANEKAMQYWAELQVSERSRAVRDRYQRGSQPGNPPTNPENGEPWDANQAGDAQAYGEIQHLQAEAFIEIMARIYWNDQIPLELFYKNGPSGPPGEDIAIHRISATQVEWKDTVWALGHEAASIQNGMLPPYKPPTPGDEEKCAPPPRPQGGGPGPEPGPGTWGIEILSFETPARRGDASGCLIQFNPLCVNKVPEIEYWLDGDPAPRQWSKCNDFRYNRAIAPKWVNNGRYRLMITGKDEHGNPGQILGEHWIDVTE